MTDTFLSQLFANQWRVLVIVGVLLLVFAEAGYRFGRRFRHRNPDAASSHGGSIQGAVLGLLGLLLGFTFAMAVGRYEARRDLVLREANAIGTAWLRADFLPSPQRGEIKAILRDYTAHRLATVAAAAKDPQRFAAARREVAGFHARLWEGGRSAVAASPSPVTATLIMSLNEVIDLDASRMAAGRNHVPGAVWLLLLLVAGCGSWASGYGSGAGGPRSTFSQAVFPLLIAVVITLIADIDRPQRGLIGVSQLPLEELLDSFQPVTPSHP
jgi:hypothetical protein